MQPWRALAPATHRTFDFIGASLRGENMPLSPALRYLATIALGLAALGARFAMLPANAGLPFLTFYPAVIIAALVFGVGSGLLATALGASLADYFFLAPLGSFALGAGSVLSLSMFVLTSGLTCALAHYVRTAARELRESEQRLRGLYESPHVGIALTDMQGRFLQFNEAFVRICGYPPEELRTLDYWTLTPRSYEAEEARQLAELGRSGRYGPYEKEYRRKDGSLIPLQLNGTLLHGRDGKDYIWSIVEDISVRKRLETRLAAESARNRMFLQTASDGVHIVNTNARVVEVSDSFCAMLGYTRDEVLGMHPSHWDARLPAALDRAGLAELLPRNRARFTTLYRRKDRSTLNVEVTAEAFELDGERYAFCAARDVTEQRRLERAVLEAADREQRHLGHDLHDGLGQELTGISMLAGALAASERRAGRPAADGLANLEELTRRAIATCRAVARGLSPLGYARGGLVEALDEMVSAQREIYGAEVRFEAIRNAPLRLTTDTADHLFRIAQEAVTNARRHSQATTIEVTLDIEAASVRLEVVDNGAGIPPTPAAPPTGGIGLRSMQYRAALIGARLAIGAADHGGTIVACECPQPEPVATATEAAPEVAAR